MRSFTGNHYFIVGRLSRCYNIRFRNQRKKKTGFESTTKEKQFMNLDFKIFLILLLVSFLLSFVISIASIFLTSKTPDKEKVSIYECGFNPMNTPGKPFSIRFFLIGVLFLVFDLEITYLFP